MYGGILGAKVLTLDLAIDLHEILDTYPSPK